MTVEELNIKITADSENFTRGMTAAIKALGQFRTNAMTAGAEVRSAFAGLIGVNTDVSGGSGGSGSASAVTMPQYGRYMKRTAPSSGSSGASQTTASSVTDVMNFKNAFTRAANVMTLDSRDTVIGAVGGNTGESSGPIEIRTTVELDGDKIGESVDRYFMSRDRITNGLEG